MNITQYHHPQSHAFDILLDDSIVFSMDHDANVHIDTYQLIGRYHIDKHRMLADMIHGYLLRYFADNNILHFTHHPRILVQQNDDTNFNNMIEDIVTLTYDNQTVVIYKEFYTENILFRSLSSQQHPYTLLIASYISDILCVNAKETFLKDSFTDFSPLLDPLTYTLLKTEENYNFKNLIDDIERMQHTHTHKEYSIF